VVAQRLLRRLCGHCRVPVTKPLSADERAFHKVTGLHPAYRAVGCSKCGGSGYAGRVPVAEVAEMNEAMAGLLAGGQHALDALRQTTMGPVASLAATASGRIQSGDTTVREAVRIVGNQFWTDAARAFERKIPAGTLRLFEDDSTSSGDPVVLVFSRDPNRARAIADALVEQRFRAVTACEPEEARQLLDREQETSLLVVDAEPGAGEEAMDLALRLRVALAWARLPFVPIIREQDAQLRQVLEDYGVSDYLVKPATPEEIALRVRAVHQR
jgi:CheY-like chemotaxis protein